MLEALCIAEGIGLVLSIMYTMYLKHQMVRQLERKTGKVRERYLKAHKGINGTFICAYCFKPVHKSKMEVDHIIPYTRGGSNHCYNLVAACEKCNGKKTDKTGLWIVRGYFGKLVLENFMLIIIMLAIIVMYFSMR